MTPNEVNCLVCRDFGWVYRRENGVYQGIARCSCKAEADRKSREQAFIKLCELPSYAGRMTFENWHQSKALKEAYEAALEVAEGKLKWLTFLGSPDQGKTHLAIAICHRWLEGDNPAKYAYVPLLLDELRRGFETKVEEGERGYQERFDFFCQVPLLVLDDLGAEYSTPWVQEKLDTLIDYRGMHELALVVTSNLTLRQLPLRIASRVQRFGKVVTLHTTEYRLRKP